MEMSKILLALLTLAMPTGSASAQQRTFYGARGNVVGGNQTTICDAAGRNNGRVKTNR